MPKQHQPLHFLSPFLHPPAALTNCGHRFYASGRKPCLWRTPMKQAQLRLRHPCDAGRYHGGFTRSQPSGRDVCGKNVASSVTEMARMTQEKAKHEIAVMEGIFKDYIGPEPSLTAISKSESRHHEEAF